MNRITLALLAAAMLVGGGASAQSTADGDIGTVQGAFGRALAIAGADLIVGEPNNPGLAGAVYVYRKAGAGWTEAATLKASDAETSDGFGNTIAANGDVMAVTASRANQNRGAVYFFHRERGSWIERARFIAADGTPAESFGQSLAVAGDLAVVGAPAQNGQVGAVYVYRRNGNSWTQAAKITSPEPKPQNFFGLAVAISGDRLLIGEPGYNERTGTVRVYARVGDSYQPVGRLAGEGVQKNDRFGSPVVTAGERAYVGATGANNMAGSVFAFTRDAKGEFKSGERHAATDAAAGDAFGSAIAANGGELWIAAPRAVQGRGAVYHMTATPTRLTLPEANAGDFFGGALASHGSLTAIAAFNDDHGLGSVGIYELANGKWTTTASLNRPDERMASQSGKKVECSHGKASEFACSNVDLLSFMSVKDLGGGRGVHLSGIWGWTDPQTDREYALVGRMDGTAFVDVTDPAHPRYLGDLPLTPGANPSFWREIKTYKDYMLVSADGAGAHGLQIFDLKQLRGVKEPKSFKPSVLYTRVNSVHNVVVNEESGFAYAVGSSSGGETCGGGLHMIDLKDALNPQFAGCFADPQTGRASTGYSHDALCVIYKGPDKDYQNREICLGSNETMLSIADVTDKKQPKAVSRAAYPKVGYLHQGWFTKDMRYFFMNDELDEVSGLVQNTRMLIWDLADLDDPQMVKEFFSPTTASDHNLYIKDDLMYQSHYKAGVRLVDVSNPLSPVEIGFFDTAPTEPDTPGFAGSWGNFPYFKSGTWIASSVNEGLFVLKKQDKKPVL